MFSDAGESIARRRRRLSVVSECLSLCSLSFFCFLGVNMYLLSSAIIGDVGPCQRRCRLRFIVHLFLICSPPPHLTEVVFSVVYPDGFNPHRRCDFSPPAWAMNNLPLGKILAQTSNCAKKFSYVVHHSNCARSEVVGLPNDSYLRSLVVQHLPDGLCHLPWSPPSTSASSCSESNFEWTQALFKMSFVVFRLCYRVMDGLLPVNLQISRTVSLEGTLYADEPSSSARGIMARPSPLSSSVSSLEKLSTAANSLQQPQPIISPLNLVVQHQRNNFIAITLPCSKLTATSCQIRSFTAESLSARSSNLPRVFVPAISQLQSDKNVWIDGINLAAVGFVKYTGRASLSIVSRHLVSFNFSLVDFVCRKKSSQISSCRGHERSTFHSSSFMERATPPIFLLQGSPIDLSVMEKSNQISSCRGQERSLPHSSLTKERQFPSSSTSQINMITVTILSSFEESEVRHESLDRIARNNFDPFHDVFSNLSKFVFLSACYLRCFAFESDY